MSTTEETPLINTTIEDTEVSKVRQYYSAQFNINLFLLSSLYLIWSNGYKAFNWHPTLMILSFYFINQALLPLQQKVSNQNKLIHQIFQTLSLISFITSFTIIYTLKSGWKVDHFNSLHTKTGAFIILSFIVGLVMGGLLHYKVISLSTSPKAWKIHRLIGYTLYTLVFLNIIGGLEMAFKLHTLPLAWVIYPSLFLSLVSVYFGVDIKKLNVF